VLLATVLGLGTVVWQHWLVGRPWAPADGSLAGHLPTVAVDAMLAVPVAAAAIWLVAAVRRRLGWHSHQSSTERFEQPGTAWAPVWHAVGIAVAFTVLAVPLAAAQSLAHLVVGPSGGHAHGAEAAVADLGTLLSHAVSQALLVQPVVLLLAICVTAARGVTAADMTGRLRRVRLRPVGLGAGTLTLVAGLLTGAFGTASAAGAVALAGTCSGAPTRTYNVVAIDVDIVVDRFGDHDPYGYMYVLADKEDEVRAQEAALQAASALPVNDPTAAKVSIGLGQDIIQPLVLRARLGECVVINLENKLQFAPRSGTGNPVVTQPGGIPSISIDMAGVSYDAAGGMGGQAVGLNPDAVMVAAGSSRQYRFYLDPTMGEGAKVFRSGGNSFQLTAHGLFGVLIAERAGSRWYDPASGAEKTTDANWSNWEAMIRPTSGPVYREFTLIYHEIGDEAFNLRRPVRENAEGPAPGDQAVFGRPLPMNDTAALDPVTPTAGGGGTNAYRPASRALNYRSEPFYRRLQLLAPRGLDAVRANESLAYSSYAFGDPATPMPRSYLGEPTKTRLVHAGFEQLHVHHVHGGATRWRLNPGADDTDMDAGLLKNPNQNAQSIRLDSQTVSPLETFNLEHECGAGGCQQAAGDFLYHCHIAHHYISGMWGIWRVYDTAQPNLAALPTKSPPAAAVTSAGLLGRTMPDGKVVVLAANLTNPSTQVALESLVEGQLPPQGARWNPGSGPDPDDATVWDWLKAGTPTAPVYQGEPETTVVWANYRSANPGVRPDIKFNPVNGRAAYPMLSPHLGLRPPFSPNGHSGAPYLGDTVAPGRPDGLCPTSSSVRSFDVTAIGVPIQATDRETDPNGEIYVLNEDKNAVLAGTKPPEPLVIRSNVRDCVAITFGSLLNPAVQQKVNMHTHLVQFDPRGSDGVVTGYAYEQSVFAATRDNRTLTTVNSSTVITVSNVDKLRTGISIGVGVGTTNIEIRTITAISGNQLTLTPALAKSHAAGDPVSVEFTKYRWFSDVDSGTVFWHDHVNGIESWAHGLFAAHIIEPQGSTYRDPVTGAAVKSGAIVDIVTNGTVGGDIFGSFREFMIFLHNGRRGRNELLPQSGSGLAFFNFGQECEEGSINLRAAPIGERTPPGATPANPATTAQRQEFNGGFCRNAFSRTGDVPTNADANTVPATVTTVDPYVFSSVKYGDPKTPLLRAYVGDNVVIRTIGLAERGEALRIQGHQFWMERFNSDGRLLDTATTGISERFDYVIDGGAGGWTGAAGDYLYYSTRNFAFESGAWGIFRVHDRLRSDLKVLPGFSSPPSGSGFPKQTAATGNTQANPGPNPAPAYNPNGSVNTAAVSSTVSPCFSSDPIRSYDISVFNKPLPTSPFVDTSGVVYSLTSDMAAIVNGTKPVEPLVLRANHGECVKITLRNQTTVGSLYGGTRAGLDMGILSLNPQLSGGSAVGLNADTTIPIGSSITYTFFADLPDTSLFTNLGSVASTRHGAYGMLIVEPHGSTWADSVTNLPLNATRTATQAIIRDGSNEYREFAMTMGTTDQHYSRSIIPYIEMIAGNGINSLNPLDVVPPPVPGAPPGTANNPGSFDKGFSNINYRTEALTQRLGLTANVACYTCVTVTGGYGIAFSSNQYGDPDTPVFKAHVGDKVVFRVGVGASDQLHAFTLGGHIFPLEHYITGSSLLASRTMAAGEVLEVWPLGGAGGPSGYRGDYLYGDARQPFQEAGMWGVFRVLPTNSSQIASL
jgi:hypothetical protein